MGKVGSARFYEAFKALAFLWGELLDIFCWGESRFFRIIESSESDTALVKEVALPYDLSFLKDSHLSTIGIL